MRVVLDLVRLSFVAGAAAWVAAAEAGLALSFAAVAAALLVTRLLPVPRVFDAAFAVTMVLLLWGGLLGFNGLRFYDLALHACVPLFAAPVATIAADRLGLVRPIGAAGFLVVTLAFGLAIGAAWEVLEWALDRAVGTDFQPTARDTATDLVADAFGAALGSALLLLTRRSP